MPESDLFYLDVLPPSRPKNLVTSPLVLPSESRMNVRLKRLETSDSSLPSLVLQIIQLVDAYMLWIGIADGDMGIGDVEKALVRGNLCNDWACAMPPKIPGTPSASTSLFRSSSSDIALSMAQRLARRFQKQIFLSVFIPSGFQSLQQEGEKGIVASIEELESII